MTKSPSCAERLRGEEQSPPPTCRWGGGLCSSPLRRCRDACSDSLGNRLGFSFRLETGDAKDGVAGPHQLPVAPAIALESDGGAVELATVGLEGEAVVGPEEVDLDATVGDLNGGVEE